MRLLLIFLISVYQRFISPYKGFNCAHHVLHGEQTCSNAVKNLISENGLLSALPLIRGRFAECREAFNIIVDQSVTAHHADIACDLPCDISLGSCGGESVETVSSCPCDLPFSDKKLSRKTRRLLYGVILLAIFVLSYFVYGRDIAYVYMTDKGVGSQSIVKRITQRGEPDIRVLLIADGKKYYSNIATLSTKNTAIKLSFTNPLSTFDIDQLQVLDARLNLADELVVVGQLIENFEQPTKSGSGNRFSYRLQRRWHFWE